MASWDRRPVATLLPQHCLEELLRNQLWILVGCFMMFHDVSWFFEIGSPFHIHKLDRKKSRHLSGSYLSYLLWLCYTRTISRVKDWLSGGCSQATRNDQSDQSDQKISECFAARLYETLRNSCWCSRPTLVCWCTGKERALIGIISTLTLCEEVHNIRALAVYTIYIYLSKFITMSHCYNPIALYRVGVRMCPMWSLRIVKSWTFIDSQ